MRHGPEHEALGAQVQQKHGAPIVRRTLDGTWGKTDPKDAHNLGDLLERGVVLFYTLPDERTTTLRRLVRLLRQARVELGACKARFRNTLLPALGPVGEPLPAAQRRMLPAEATALPAACVFDGTDLAPHLSSVRTRIARLEVDLLTVVARCRRAACS